MNLRALSPVILFALLALSCSEKDDVAITKDYLPSTAGSVWTYTGDFPQLIRVTGMTQTVNGKVYEERETIGDDGQKYYGLIRKENGVYFALSPSGIFLNGDPFEFILLKDNVPTGTSWTQTPPVTDGDITYVYKKTIDSRDISFKVNDVIYDRVIVVKNEITRLGNDTPLSIHYAYFAHGIGLIRDQKSDFGFSDLDSFDVK